MFHLLVAYKGWPDGAGTLPSERVYIKAENEKVRAFFGSDGNLEVSKIGRIPALLTTETGGDGPQFARVAYITGVTQGPRNTTLQYAVDSSVKPISNAALEGMGNLLGLNKYTLTHTHWEILDGDLFKALLLNQQACQPVPEVFKTDEISNQQQDLVSVMMPFHAEFNPVYAALQAAIASARMTAKRADDLWEHHFVIQDVVNLIVRAQVVICDCSGRNPNVFYEAGIAHALGKNVILITQSENDIPFDLRHIRYFKYLNNGEGLAALTEAVASRIRTIVEKR